MRSAFTNRAGGFGSLATLAQQGWKGALRNRLLQCQVEKPFCLWASSSFVWRLLNCSLEETEMAPIAKAGHMGKMQTCFRELCHCPCLPAWMPACAHNGTHYL